MYPGEHALLPVTLLQDDRGQCIARPVRVIIDDNIVIPMVTADLLEGAGQATSNDGLIVESTPAQARLQILIAGRQDKDAMGLGVALQHALGSLDVDVQEDKVSVKMTLTAPGCGMGTFIANDARQKILELEGVADATVDLVWDPPWDPSKMSEEAKLKLGIG